MGSSTSRSAECFDAEDSGTVPEATPQRTRHGTCGGDSVCAYRRDPLNRRFGGACGNCAHSRAPHCAHLGYRSRKNTQGWWRVGHGAVRLLRAAAEQRPAPGLGTTQERAPLSSKRGRSSVTASLMDRPLQRISNTVTRSLWLRRQQSVYRRSHIRAWHRQCG